MGRNLLPVRQGDEILIAFGPHYWIHVWHTLSPKAPKSKSKSTSRSDRTGVLSYFRHYMALNDLPTSYTFW
jgi:hypothetical protein